MILAIPFLSYLFSIVLVAIFGEYIKKNNYLLEEFVACIVLILTILIIWKFKK
jgi:hypothetical protein